MQRGHLEKLAEIEKKSTRCYQKKDRKKDSLSCPELYFSVMEDLYIHYYSGKRQEKSTLEDYRKTTVSDYLYLPNYHN